MKTALSRWKTSLIKRKFRLARYLENRSQDTSRQANHVQHIFGEAPPEGGRFCVYCIWQKSGIPWYVRNALAALARQRVNVLVITNARLDAASREFLQQHCWRVLERANVGRDFGAYKDGTLYLREHVAAIDSILYLNDSIYLFAKTTPTLFERLYASTSDVCTPFESWERIHHIQSYFLLLNQRIVTAPNFWEFWESYRPIDSRNWAIQRGELGLSACVKQCAPSIDIIYSTHALKKQLETLPDESIRRAMSLMPRYMRVLVQGKDRTELINHCLQRMTGVSECHHGALLYIEYQDCPILKRDIVFSGVFLPFEVAATLQRHFDSAEIDQAMDEIRCKGMLTHLTQIERYKTRY